MISMENLNTLLFVGGLTTILFFILVIGLYVLFVLGLYGLARTERTGNEWFAFIPVLQLYIIGKILRELRAGSFTVPKLELVLPLAPFAVMIVDKILNAIPAVGGLLSLLLNIVYIVFSIMITYNFYKRYCGGKAAIMTVLSVIFFFMGPIYVFSMRDSKPL